MEKKHSEQLGVNVGWYVNRIKELEEENYKHQDTIAGLEGALEIMKEELERVTKLLKQFQNAPESVDAHRR
jgi:uncharacterized coiled-coil protein SlyX